uniref:Gustatory receptor n=1 Tax=Anopheles epiroticus TaxID=199890 RepID=A0A182PLP4_9DIPT
MPSMQSLLIVASFKAFSCLLILFHLVGFFNFRLKLNHTTGLTVGPRRWTSSIWCILHLLLTVLSGIMAKHHYNLLFKGLMITDTMNNYLKYVIGLVTIFVSLADSWFEVEAHRTIWCHYRDLATRYGTIVGLVGRAELAQILLRYIATFLTILLVCAVVECIIFTGLTPGTQWHWFWMHNFYPYTYSHLRHVFHLLHIALMASNLRQLGRKLVVLQQQQQQQQQEALAMERMAELRVLYGELWQINEGINQLFGFSQAFNIACSFAQIAFDLYWVYAMWQKQEERIHLQLYCFFPTPVIIGFLMHEAKNYQLAMDAVEAAVLDMNSSQNPEMVRFRFYFLHQLLRHRLKLTARNIFDFDYTLIRKLVIVILTYVIIFIEISDDK